MTILHSRITRDTYYELVDKVHKGLAGWKSNFLSLARRATLIQAATAAILIYAKQIIKLPMSTHEELDCINRNFFF